MDNHSKKLFMFIGAGVALIASAVMAKPLLENQNPATSTKPATVIATASAQETTDLRDTVLEVTSGDIRPVLAVAAEQGSSKGVFVGKVAAEVQKQFGNATVMIKAVRMNEMVDGCPKIVATIYQKENPSSQEEVVARVCPKKRG